MERPRSLAEIEVFLCGLTFLYQVHSELFVPGTTQHSCTRYITFQDIEKKRPLRPLISE
jgi:hypothetical protein